MNPQPPVTRTFTAYLLDPRPARLDGRSPDVARAAAACQRAARRRDPPQRPPRVVTSPRVRFGIDATFVRCDRWAGPERYAASLIRALAALASDELVLFLRPDAPPALADLRVERHVAPLGYPIAVDQGWLPWAAP